MTIYLGPSWKKSCYQENVVDKERIRQMILNEFASIDDKFYMHWEDFDYMLSTLDENVTPKMFYAKAIEYPEDYVNYLNDNRPIYTI